MNKSQQDLELLDLILINPSYSSFILFRLFLPRDAPEVVSLPHVVYLEAVVTQHCVPHLLLPEHPPTVHKLPEVLLQDHCLSCLTVHNTVLDADHAEPDIAVPLEGQFRPNLLPLILFRRRVHPVLPQALAYHVGLPLPPALLVQPNRHHPCDRGVPLVPPAAILKVPFCVSPELVLHTHDSEVVHQQVNRMSEGVVHLLLLHLLRKIFECQIDQLLIVCLSVYYKFQHKNNALNVFFSPQKKVVPNPHFVQPIGNPPDSAVYSYQDQNLVITKPHLFASQKRLELLNDIFFIVEAADIPLIEPHQVVHLLRILRVEIGCDRK